MGNLKLSDVLAYVEQNIGTFHEHRLSNLSKLKLKEILKRKNPYLFKAKNVQTSEQIVKALVDAHLSSSEEGIFGDWLEGLAIFINQKVFSGRKSGIPGIDLEFDKDNIRYIISIKSGPNWGNSQQIRKLKDDFQKAIQSLKTSNSKLQIIPVNGCCYGKDSKPFKNGIYYKYCGQVFWEFISGEKNLYLDFIEPLGFKAKEKNEQFQESYSNLLNRFVKEFIIDFCNVDGSIDWGKIVKLNSAEYLKKVKK